MIATTIEQSKKLMELGLLYQTADMFYGGVFELNDSDHKTDSFKLDNYPYPIGEPHDIMVAQHHFQFNLYKTQVPAWSLDCLLKLMPKINNNPLELLGGNGHYICGYTLNKEESDYISFSGETPFEAAYNMMVWLLENNYIKTEEK